jgi:hypothetical protein
MVGTEKQVNWATTIKAKMVKILESKIQFNLEALEGIETESIREAVLEDNARYQQIIDWVSTWTKAQNFIDRSHWGLTQLEYGFENKK